MFAGRSLSIDEQVARMKAFWPHFSAKKIDRARQYARWTGHVEPNLTRYRLDVRYTLGSFPEVRVLSPSLTRLPGNVEGALPHVYPPADDPTLCLFDPMADEWDFSMAIAETTVRWACDWITCYEFWLMTGIWRGGGRHAGTPPSIREDTP